jgi:uncharacterized protein (TIGR00369 family)
MDDAASIFAVWWSAWLVDSALAFPFNRRVSPARPRFAELASQLATTAYIAGLKGEVVEAGGGRARMRLPYGEHLVGDPQTGVVHGGVITGCLDHCCGIAVASALREPMPFATLDLRIDYMKAAMPHEDLLFESECLKVAREIAFARGVAYQADRADPVAICTATFMLIRGATFPNPPDVSNG